MNREERKSGFEANRERLEERTKIKWKKIAI